MDDDYALYLDDIRYPPQTGENWVLCRTLVTLVETLERYGIPSVASFDYDLGRTDPGHSGDDAVSVFLDFLIEHPPVGEEIDVEVRLHTSSRYGEARMAQLLKKRSADYSAVGVRLLHRY